jgi:DNA invertase Pin-like site-specific DNA recombinase
MEKLRIASAYIRVSTDDQLELSPDSQIKVIREYAKQNGFIVPTEYIYRDDGISGRRADKRPAFNQMIATAKETPSPFSAILLWKFSRFARNQEESIFYKSMLRKRGIDVISTSEPIIDGPFGSLIERIIEWSDEYYSIRLSGEVKRGMKEKVSRGGAVSIPAFGYDIVNKQYIINPANAEIVKKIYNDYLKGKGCSTIARELNAIGIRTTKGNYWENRTVEYILYNPVYIGKIRWNPKGKTRRNYDDKNIMIVDGQHEPIIDTAVFNDVQKKLADTKKMYRPYQTDRKNGKEFMLKGLVKCSNCGSTLAMGASGSLQCVKYAHSKCNVSHSIAISKLNNMVIMAIEQVFLTGNFDLVSRQPVTNKPDSINIDLLIEREQAKLKRIKEAYEEGVYNLAEFKHSKEIVNNHIANLLKQKNATQPILSQKEQKLQLIEKHKDIVSQLKSPNLSETEKNEILKSFVDKIVFHRPTETINLFFYA